MLTQEELKKALHYDPLTGIFTNRVTRNRAAKIGERAGNVSKGYRRVGFHGKIYFEHRLVWLYVHGFIPDRKIAMDHINMDGLDNRLDNLRLADSYQNGSNVRKRSTNKSGFKGVRRSNNGERWVAGIRHHCRGYHIGTYDTPEEAAQAYNNKALELFGEFAHLNEIQ